MARDLKNFEYVIAQRWIFKSKIQSAAERLFFFSAVQLVETTLKYLIRASTFIRKDARVFFGVLINDAASFVSEPTHGKRLGWYRYPQVDYFFPPSLKRRLEN